MGRVIELDNMKFFDHFLAMLFTIFQNPADNFAFKDDSERQKYYETYNHLTISRTEPFSFRKLLLILIQALLLLVISTARILGIVIGTWSLVTSSGAIIY